MTKNAPAILVGVGTASVIAGAVCACKASWKAKEVHSAMHMERGYVEPELKQEYLKRVAPSFIPVVILTGGGIACFMAARRLDLKKQMAMASAYSMLSETANLYQDKVIERLGQEQHEEIMNEIAEQDLITKFPATYEEESGVAIVAPGKGDVLVFDKVTGRYFYSDLARLKDAEAEVTRRCLDEMSVTVNDFYEAMGLPDVSYVGNAIGWDAMKCPPDIFYRSMLDENNRPCLVLVYETTVVNPYELHANRSQY